MKRFITLSSRYFLLLNLLCVLCSCDRGDEWLDAKRNKGDVRPATLSDFQAILDNNLIMNRFNPIIGLVGSDNIYVPGAAVNSLGLVSRNAYLWQKDIYEGQPSDDWSGPYQAVEYSNIVLDGLKKLPEEEGAGEYATVKGSALFYRAFSFYMLAQLFCRPYDQQTSSSDPGIPLRETSDVNVKSVRATVSQTYQRIKTDLQLAASLLPVTPLYRTRPSSLAARAMLAKVALSMGDYQEAFDYVNGVLAVYPDLLDYNTLSTGTANPFPSFSTGNPEIIFFTMTYGLNTVWSSSSVKARVDPVLYQSYDAADLRKKVFFLADGNTGYFKFKGSYSAQSYNFCGIATDELYLIRAECSARLGDPASALKDLNTLLQKRYTRNDFQPWTTADPTVLLEKIILERRKELPFTGNLRWEDLRRFNKDPRFAKNLTRTVNGTGYALAPGDNRYVYPVPDDEIRLNGLTQNPR